MTLKEKLIDNKANRNTIIITVLGAAMLAAFAYMIMKPKKVDLPAEISGASIAAAPSTGLTNARKEEGENPLMEQMRAEINRQKADEAEKLGSTMIPKADQYQLPNPDDVNKIQEPPKGQIQGRQPVPYESQPQGTRGQDRARQDQMVSMAASSKQQAYEGLLKRWDPDSAKVFAFDGEAADSAKGGLNRSGAPATDSASRGTSPVADNSPTIIYGGDIVTAKIDTFVNTDKPGPVKATILSGPLAGGNLLGQVERQEDTAKITFNAVTHAEKGISASIDAISLDAQSMQTGVATDVDNHIFEKYVVRPLATGAKSLADAIIQNRQSTVANLTGIQTTNRPLNGGDQAAVVLGAMATQFVRDTRGQPLAPTVYVDPKHPGSVVGVLFLKSVTQNDLLSKRK